MQWSCSKNLRKTFSFANGRKSNKKYWWNWNWLQFYMFLILCPWVRFQISGFESRHLGSNPDIWVRIQTSGHESRHLWFESRHLWVRIQTSLKNKNRRHKQMSGQHTLARQTINIKIYKKYKKMYAPLLHTPACYLHTSALLGHCCVGLLKSYNT
jgi:hypothetical protein